MANKRTEHYLRNSALLRQVVEAKKTGRVSDDLYRMFRLLAERSSRRLHYVDDMDREDCVSHAVYDCCLYFERFDPLKTTNAFAYFTTVCKNGMAKAWNDLHPPEEKQRMRLSDFNSQLI